MKRTIVLAAAWVGLAVFLMFLAGRCLLGKTLPASKTVVPAEERTGARCPSPGPGRATSI